jgi:uncharacterized membrane protein YphA (DoxX/SURF4 family)
MSRVTKWIPNVLAAFMALVFLDSLRFKFLNLPNTQVIFGKLDAWGASVGAPGLFGQTGLFSQYVIGSIELLAASLLLLGILPRFRHLQAGGALAGVLVMLGAVSFHLFTPLGTDPNNDGGGLFVAACTNLGFGLLLLAVFRRRELGELISRVLAIFAPSRSAVAAADPTAKTPSMALA